MLLAQHSVGPLYAQHEDSVLLIAPPRMGKTHGFGINAILDAPGAAVCTSTKAEVVRLTAALRETGGRPVFVFDPENIANWPTQLRWSPIEGCENPSVAIEGARAFVGALRSPTVRVTNGSSRRPATPCCAVCCTPPRSPAKPCATWPAGLRTSTTPSR